MARTIEPGFQTFLSDSAEPFGAVRFAHAGKKEVIVSVDNAGDFAVPVSAVKEVQSRTVTFDCNKIDKGLRRAIELSHNYEAL